MSAAQWLGAVIVALPFVALAVFMAREVGVVATAGIFALVAFVIALMCVGTALLMGGVR